MMPKYVQDKQGRVWEDEGDGMGRLLSSEETAAIGQNPLETFGKSAAVSAAQAYLGGKQLLTGRKQDDLAIAEQMQQGMGNINPIAQLLGQAAPAVGAAVATAGAGIPAMMATEAALGAAYAPESPWVGAGIGAGAAGLGAAAPTILRAGARAVPKLADAVSGVNSPMMGILPGRPTMAQRVMDNIDAATPAAETPRYLKGLATPAEMEGIGATVTPAQRMILDARSGAEIDMGRRLLWREGITGVTDGAKQANQRAMANVIKREAGIADDVGLTDEVVNAAKNQAGEEIGRILNVASDVPMPAATWSGIKEAAELAIEGQGSKSLSGILGNLEKSIKRNGQVMTPEAYQGAISALNKLNTPAAPAATKQGAAELRRLLSDEALKTLGEAEKKLLADARYKYKILKTLESTGVRGGSFEVNPRSFYTQWTKKTRQSTRGEDVLGKTAGTLRLLDEMPANAGTTLQRGIVGLQKKAPGIAAGGLATALGLQGLGSIFGN